MADQKISQLTELTFTTVDANDLYPVVDVSATTTKSIKNSQIGNVVQSGDNYLVNNTLNQTSGASGVIVGLNSQIFANADKGYIVGEANQIKSGDNSYILGTNNSTSGAISAAIGYGNAVEGNDSFAFGKNVRTPSGVLEVGIWNTTGSRGASVRCGKLDNTFNPGDGYVTMSLPNTGTHLSGSAAAEGAEELGAIPDEMCMFRRNGDEIFVDFHNGVSVKSVSLGSGTSTNNTSSGAPIQNVRSDTTTVNHLRQLTQTEYDAITPQADTVYIIVG